MWKFRSQTRWLHTRDFSSKYVSMDAPVTRRESRSKYTWHRSVGMKDANILPYCTVHLVQFSKATRVVITLCAGVSEGVHDRPDNDHQLSASRNAQLLSLIVSIPKRLAPNPNPNPNGQHPVTPSYKQNESHIAAMILSVRLRTSVDDAKPCCALSLSMSRSTKLRTLRTVKVFPDPDSPVMSMAWSCGGPLELA